MVGFSHTVLKTFIISLLANVKFSLHLAVITIGGGCFRLGKLVVVEGIETLLVETIVEIGV